MSRYGASTFSSLLKDCVLWAPLQHSAGVSGDIDEFPIIPSGVTVTNSGTFTKTSLGNNKSVLNFDGSTNYISLTDVASWDFDLNQDFTISFWAKYVAGPPYPTIVCTCPGTAASAGWMTSIGYEYRFSFYATTGTSSWNICNVTSIISWTSGQWYHFMIVRKDNVITLYRDMTQTAQATVPNAITSSNTLKIGYDGAQSNTYHNSNIKDLMIWKGRALTQSEIKLLMNRTHPETGAGLLPGGYDYWVDL